ATLARGADRHPDGLPRDDEAAEVIEKARELRIAGGVRNPAVKGEILIDCRIAAADGGTHRFIGAFDTTQIGGRRPFGREPRCLPPDARAPLHPPDPLTQRHELAAPPPKTPAARHLP